MESVDIARKARNFYGYSKDQELDLIELGERPARCLKGENGPRRQSILVGRVRRGLRFARPFRIRGDRREWWMDW